MIERSHSPDVYFNKANFLLFYFQVRIGGGGVLAGTRENAANRPGETLLGCANGVGVRVAQSKIMFAFASSVVGDVIPLNPCLALVLLRPLPLFDGPDHRRQAGMIRGHPINY